ncbi:large ribosomal subunit protein bL32m [Bacillus rossius redtenbacheri]|uniref:large ribosomal subunit protein bL32m n=1 Tax=Bacillus rossius redtenbacheri TaxID=93214 RepID=UPI002FDEC230
MLEIMALNAVRRLSNTLKQLDNMLINVLRQTFAPEHWPGTQVALQGSGLAGHGSQDCQLPNVWEDGMLWAVPKSRRSVEKRLKRKFGHPDYVYKLLQPKRNLLVCSNCGHHHEAGVLCPHCYEKIRLETEAMQTKIEAELGLSPVEQEVIVLYEGEAEAEPNEFWKGKRIVEMDKPRPSWFSKNLLQKTTTPPSDSSDVKPSELA